LLAALAGLLSLRLLRAGLVGQVHRLALYRAQGITFADPACTTGYCDHAMFWVAGHLVRAQQTATLYDLPAYLVAAAKLLPDQIRFWPFIYPPFVLPYAVLVSHLPLAAGYYVAAAVLTACALALLRGAGLPWWCIAVGCLSPMALWDLYLGQLGLVCGAALFAGLVWLPRRPVLAGALLGLLCVKPQYALLVPLAVLAGRHWRAMAAGIVALVFVAVLSLAIAGPVAWAAYLGPGRAALAGLMTQPFGPGPQDGATSVFWMLRSLHLPLMPAYAGQALAALAASVACWRLWARGAPNAALLTVLLTYFVTPYGYDDDLAIYAVLLCTLFRRNAPWRKAALAWAYLLPAYMPMLSVRLFLPTPLILLSVLLLAAQDDLAPTPEAQRKQKFLRAFFKKRRLFT
jgi:hypothetical protein